MDVVSGLRIFHKTYNPNCDGKIEQIEKEAQEFISGCTEIISHETAAAGGGQYGYFRISITIIGK